VKTFHVFLIGIAVLIAARLAWPRLEAHLARRRERLPDAPIPFGTGLPWIAVRSKQTRSVVAALGLEQPEAANWRAGFRALRDDVDGQSQVYVSPPIAGWTLVAGVALPAPVGQRFKDKCTPLLSSLGKEFIEVQYFQGDSSIEFYAWARLLNGKLVRAFAIGDEGIIWNRGKVTKDERALGLKLFELRGIDGGAAATAMAGDLFSYPTEEHVQKLASRWSLDPTQLDDAEPSISTGYLGRAPAAWRSELARS
jgi:hypothetical protein